MIKDTDKVRVDYGELKFHFLNEGVCSIYCHSDGGMYIYDIHDELINSSYNNAFLKDGELFGQIVKNIYSAAVLKQRNTFSESLFWDKLLLPDGVIVTVLRPDIFLLFEKPFLIEKNRDFDSKITDLLRERTCVLTPGDSSILSRSIARYMISCINNTHPVLVFNYDSSLLNFCTNSTTVDMWKHDIAKYPISEQKSIADSYIKQFPQLFSMSIYTETVEKVDHYVLLKNIESNMLITPYRDRKALDYALNAENIFSSFDNLIVIDKVYDKDKISCSLYSNKEGKFTDKVAQIELGIYILTSY